MVPARRFRLLRGEGALSCYQFGTKTAKHLFCSVCGICPFYVPRSNPDSYAVTVFCIKVSRLEPLQRAQPEKHQRPAVRAVMRPGSCGRCVFRLSVLCCLAVAPP